MIDNNEKYNYLTNIEKVIIAMNKISNNINLNNSIIRIHEGRRNILLKQIDEALDTGNKILFCELGNKLKALE